MTRQFPVGGGHGTVCSYSEACVFRCRCGIDEFALFTTLLEGTERFHVRRSTSFVSRPVMTFAVGGSPTSLSMFSMIVRVVVPQVVPHTDCVIQLLSKNGKNTQTITTSIENFLKSPTLKLFFTALLMALRNVSR